MVSLQAAACASWGNASASIEKTRVPVEKKTTPRRLDYQNPFMEVHHTHADFGTFESLQERLTEAATKVFGSGWAFLAIDSKTQRLEVMSLPNQDSPLLTGQCALLACDVWEHSYYLKYQNRRPDYLKAWWSVVQWDEVSSRLESLRHEALVTHG